MYQKFQLLFTLLIIALVGCTFDSGQSPLEEDSATEEIQVIIEESPTVEPTDTPLLPTETDTPTSVPSNTPTDLPTVTPSPEPTATPTLPPPPTTTKSPSLIPLQPTSQPTLPPATQAPPAANTCGGESKFRVENLTTGPATMYLTGPCNYTYNIPLGVQRIDVKPGVYQITILMCGQRFSGSHKITAKWKITLKCP